MADRPVGRITLGRLTVAAAIFLLLVVTFAYIAREVIRGETLGGDRLVLLRLNHFATPTFDSIVVGITSLGDVISIAVMTLAVLLLLAFRRKWQAFTQVSFSLAGAAMLNFILKLLFERDRPRLWEQIIHESSYSFPSGHAMLTGAFVFALIVITWRTRYRWVVAGGGGVYLVAIGFSRLYLGVHYPTDIVAGWCASLAWVVTVATVLGAIRWRYLVR